MLLISKAPLNEQQKSIMERFAGVFNIAYTRFLDLQKSEAQAREAQIEAALERVRSRTMGMQKSEELKEVIQVVYEQFVHLNILIEHTGFIMDYKVRDDMHIWLADQHEVPFQVTIPYFDCAHWNSFNEAKEKGMDFFANHLSFEEKNRFYQNLLKGESKVQALRAAQCSLLNQAGSASTHPYFWAAFRLVGDVSPLKYRRTQDKSLTFATQPLKK